MTPNIMTQKLYTGDYYFIDTKVNLIQHSKINALRDTDVTEGDNKL